MSTSTSRRGIKRIAAVIATAGLAVGLVLGVAAVPASAHEGNLSGVPGCVDGAPVVHWTYIATDTHESEADAHVIKHEPVGTLADGHEGQYYWSTWTEHQINNPGVPTIVGDFTYEFDQTRFPAGATSATVQVQVDWKDGASDKDPAVVVSIPTDCAPVVVPSVAKADIVTTPATCDVGGSAAWTGLENATGAELDQTPGAHAGLATATGTALFEGGTTTLSKDYTLEAKLDATQPPCYTPPAPPTVNVCETTTDGPVATNLNPQGWGFSETRATGHNEFVAGGLHVYTEGNTSTDKAAGYLPVNFSLKDAGVPSITFENASGVLPGLQLGVDRDGNGTWDGYLVNEGDTYGAGNWWTNKTGFGVPAGGGYPSLGTLDAYLAANPNAQVLSIGYSLGSGVKGDVVIKQITAGCERHTFDFVAKAIEPKPEVTTKTTTSFDCTTDVATETTTTTTVTYRYVDASNTWVANAPEIAVNSTTRPLTDTEQTEDCPVVVPPTTAPPVAVPPTTSETPSPVVDVSAPRQTDVLANTGVNAVGVILGIVFLLVLGAILYILTRRIDKRDPVKVEEPKDDLIL